MMFLQFKMFYPFKMEIFHERSNCGVLITRGHVIALGYLSDNSVTIIPNL